ncbi:hypothetical protein ZEAMMB73_Zm00001d000322 [Zea mays]|nr:hypothetical protein ZEAMMB73_Zm00001d000322 [Zea mays]
MDLLGVFPTGLATSTPETNTSQSQGSSDSSGNNKSKSHSTEPLCFLRQFKGSIIRSDYLALRLGFVTYHKLPHSYDFHKYMVQSMEDDYNGTIGIRFSMLTKRKGK